jgi:multicomponent K+:H+ antiporter subunit E/multicomponent Na+:H+ antiporter subunit E
MSRNLFIVALLTLVYALTLASFKPLDLLTGALLASALLVATRGKLFRGNSIGPLEMLRRMLAFWPFVLRVAWDVLEGTWLMLLIALRLRPLREPGISEVPFGERSRSGVIVTTLVTTLSPGSFLVDIDWERKVMLYHNIDNRDPEAMRRKHAELYERYQRHVFP